jgi:hypothetical protein
MSCFLPARWHQGGRTSQRQRSIDVSHENASSIREYFDAIVEGRKPVEYRPRSAFWRKRLEGRNYDLIKFRNGYSPKAPQMLVNSDASAAMAPAVAAITQSR